MVHSNVGARVSAVAAVFAAWMIWSTSAHADEPWHPAFETDPVDFVFGGYALHTFVKPPGLSHFRFGAGVFGLELPQFLVDLSAADKGFNVRIERGVGTWANYYFNPSRRGFFLSAQVTVTETRYRLEGQETNVVGFGVIPRIGFQWFPVSGSGFYLSPMLGVAPPNVKLSTPTLAGRTYVEPIVTPLPAIHVGFEF